MDTTQLQESLKYINFIKYPELHEVLHVKTIRN